MSSFSLNENSHNLKYFYIFYFIISFFFFNFIVPIYEVSGVEGGNVHLPCNISIAENSHHEEDNVVLVLWYREDLGTPIYR